MIAGVFALVALCPIDGADLLACITSVKIVHDIEKGCKVVFRLIGFGSCFFWPPVQNVISALTDLIATSGNFGLFLYGFLERFLIPTGLHHLIYTPFQFSALGNSLTVGDATYTGSIIMTM